MGNIVVSQTPVQQLKSKNKFQNFPKYVSGLGSVNVYSSEKFNKLIIILGEGPDHKGLCGDIKNESTRASRFFFKLLDTVPSNMLADVFLEVGYDPKTIIKEGRFKKFYADRGGLLGDVTNDEHFET